MRHILCFTGAATLLALVACGGDETTPSESASSEGSGAGATAAGTGGGATTGSGGAGTAGASSSAAASSSSSGQGGGGDGCTGKACGSGCIGEAGNGICDPGGSCVVTPVSCAGYTPCEGAKCGSVCSSCDPADPTCSPATGTVCDITEVCIYPPPACD